MKFGIAQWCFSADIADVVEHARNLGCASLHLDLGIPDSPQWLGHRDVIRRLISLREHFEIEFVAIAVNLLCDNGITKSFNTDAVQVAWYATQVSIDAAQLMEIPVVTLPSFDQSQINTDQDLGYTKDFLSRACEYGEQGGIKIASENNLGMLKQLELLNAVNMQNFRLFFDTYNPCVFGHDPVNIWKRLNPYMPSMLHIKDGIGEQMGNVLLGDGAAPLARLIKEIKNETADIELIIETDYPLLGKDAWELLRKDVSTVQELWVNS